MRPEDFMDEEDLAEMQESRKLVDKDELAGPVPQPSAEDEYVHLHYETPNNHL